MAVKMYESGRDIIVEGGDNSILLGGQFRNFAGEKRQYNDAGQRNFNLRIPTEFVDFFQQLGVNIKPLGQPEEGEDPIHFVRVKINTNSRRPPELYLVKGHGEPVELTPDQYKILDSAFFDSVDLVMNVSHYKEFTTLYLNKGYFKLHMDPISEKYSKMMDDMKGDPNLSDVELEQGQEEEVPFV